MREILNPNESYILATVCEGCGCNYVDDWDDPTSEYCRPCMRRERRFSRIQRFQRTHSVEPFYVVAFATSRHYGGPEEGGWWYDRTDVLEVLMAWGPKDGIKKAKHLREAYPTCPRGRHSVIGGDDIDIRCCYDPADWQWVYEQERPRYC